MTPELPRRLPLSTRIRTTSHYFLVWFVVLFFEIGSHLVQADLKLVVENDLELLIDPPVSTSQVLGL